MGDKGGKKNREKQQRQSDNKLHRKTLEKRMTEHLNRNLQVLRSLMK